MLFCCSKCVDGDDEKDSEYHVEDRSVQYNIICCSNGDRDQDRSFQYIPAYRNSGNNYHRAVVKMALNKIRLLHRKISEDYVLARRDLDEEAARRVLTRVRELARLGNAICREMNCVLQPTCYSSFASGENNVHFK